MLTEIRDRSTGWFAGIIAALIIIPMAFWGVQDYTSTEAQPTIIEVGDEKITQQAFQAQLSNQRAQILQRNPNLASSEIFTSDVFKRQILDSMINNAVTRQIADQQNYRIGNEELAKYLQENELFQTDGKFDKQAYENFVASRSASKQQFENDVRENTRIFHVRSGYQESALVLPDEVRELLEIQVEKRSFDLVTINQADFIDSVTVSEEEVSAYYQDNIDQFMEDDRVSVNYVEIDPSKIAAEVEISEQEIKTVYEENQANYTLPETRKTSHILLAIDADNSDSDQLTKAQSLIDQLNSGADFATLAKEHSQDPGSASNGGSLGEVEPGAMVEEFDQAAFSLEAGVISQPIKTQFGYHIIKVDEIIGGKPQPFEEVKVAIEQEQRNVRAQDIMVERTEQLRNLVFEQAESLAGVAEEMGLEIKTSGLFSRQNGSGIASNDLFRSTAFSEQVVTDGLNSEPFEINNGVQVALRQLQFKPSEPKKLADVSEQIKIQITNQRASDAAKQAGDSILASATTDWSQIAADSEVKMESYTVAMVDQNQQIANDVLNEVFKTQLDGQSTKVVSFTGANGDFNILRLNKVEAGDIASVSAQVKDATRRLIEQRNGTSLFHSYLQGLTDQYKDQVNQDLL